MQFYAATLTLSSSAFCLFSQYNLHPIEQAVLETLAEIERENLSPELRESKRTSAGCLALMTFQLQGDSVGLQLDISLREGRKKGEPITVTSSYMSAFTVIDLAREELAKKKVNALLTRQKARDFTI